MACDRTVSMPMTQPIPTADWTCPFCSLLCEGLALSDAGALLGSDCARALSALTAHSRTTPASGPSIDGVPVTLAAALAAAALRIAAWRQPLFGGLGTDIAGARVLYRLAARTSAICDHADGATLMHGVRAVQDRGQYITTLAELRSRADLIVCVGTPAVARFPEFFRRAGLGGQGSPCRSLVFLGVEVPAAAPGALATQAVRSHGDLFADVQQLAALVAAQRVRNPDRALVALAAQLRAAKYAVLVWEAATLPAEGALIVEALNRIVGTLNRTTRAATFALGGSDGAFSVNQTFTWLSGLPLRTRVSASGLQHEPRLFDAQRLLARGAVDGLLWISSFNPERVPPSTTLPRIVLGPPAMALALPDAARDCVFIPVATPGLNAAGHLFRTDGPIVLPVFAARDDGLPGVAAVLTRLCELLELRA
jgi:formylmethanofuran dehydrogenase subunit B